MGQVKYKKPGASKFEDLHQQKYLMGSAQYSVNGKQLKPIVHFYMVMVFHSKFPLKEN